MDGGDKGHCTPQGPLLALALGTNARTLVDDVADSVLARGAILDLGDGQGNVHRRGVDILFALLMNKFSPDVKAQMLRCGLDFFLLHAHPRRGPQILVLEIRHIA